MNKALTLREAMAQRERPQLGNLDETQIRDLVLESSKDFKTSWVMLGQVLYGVWKDKLYKSWGYEKFETYVTKEVGIRKQTAVKLLRSYFFLEKEEPGYLQEEFKASSPPSAIPTYETVDVLRLAKNKKDLSNEDYCNLKKAVFEKGKDAPAVRRDLTALMKQRREVDPDEERAQRKAAAVRRFLNAYRSFKKDREVLKLVPAHLLREADSLMLKIEKETF